VILFFGPPGSGKSVQGQLLVERNGWRWLSTGQMVRDSEDPEVHAKLKAGELIDDELTNKVVEQALHNAHGQGRVVLDGYPRNPTQAKWLEEHLPQHGRDIKLVVVFETPQEELVRRLAGRGRTEDTPAVIERRLDIYAKNTKPVLDYFRDSGVQVVEVDGMGSVETVHERIQEAVERCIPK
jgi:adenylate kinase